MIIRKQGGRVCRMELCKLLQYCKFQKKQCHQSTLQIKMLKIDISIILKVPIYLYFPPKYQDLAQYFHAFSQ